MPIAVIVDWYGAYEDISALRRMVRDKWPADRRTLYMALGSHNIVRYIGLTESPVARIRNRHPEMEDEDNRKFYVGEIVTQGISGPRGNRRAPDLRLAERALIRYLQPELNKKLISTEPDDCVSVFSRFYDSKDFETPRYPLPKFPALLGFSYWSQNWFRGDPRPD